MPEVDIVIPVPAEVGGDATQPEECDCMALEYIDQVTASVLMSHVNGGLQRQADGAGHYAENLRYDYLFQKNRVSFADSIGVRHTEESGSGRVRMLDSGLGQPVSGK